jgi:hypothetical protein
MISALQYDINTIIGDINDAIAAGTSDVNTAFTDLTGVAQDAINFFYEILNEIIGLAEGESIPVAQIRNLSQASVQIYLPGSDATVYWVAIQI